MNYSCINFKTNVGNYNYEDASHPHAVSEVENMENKYYYLDKGVMVIRENNAFKSYLTFTDNLGSILAVMDKKGEKVFEASYDRWGKQTIKLNKIGLQRGYTEYEMLNDFDIINMNGRLYDSVLGRFLSPDNFVQMPDNAQSYNRYSYYLNNPLKYTDPSGEAFVIDDATIAFTIFSVASSMMQAAATGGNVWKADAAIGVWFGGGGVIPGAIIGGAIGSVAGSFSASWIGTGAVDGLYGR